ncbi:hypothetical protein DK412_04835 [Methylobacterium sp. 17Sr1-1]|nr:hypothetical protein DK412_04835 [Methylobacterium sp. 17Sr1-1]
MVTAFLLLAQYGGAAVISISLVCRDYCSHLTPEMLIRKISVGGIALPLVRIEASQKAAKGVHLVDPARWIDQRAEAARKECRQLCGAAYVEGGRAGGRVDKQVLGSLKAADFPTCQFRLAHARSHQRAVQR